ncbi:glyoxylase I 4 [Andrographis paniculata]|uniref:glyoxylase I 4 n=1 Tax=Andrographis paniculata TaxID=175694 RepID=UPI0021E843A6|nr:glyoxylase I 4 [Andrographis paniculata]
MKEMKSGNPLQLSSVNHISLVCKSVQQSLDFYQNLLGFAPVRRPGSLKFDGAWLFGHGIGIHLLQSETPQTMTRKTVINPKDNHISFQCESMATVEKRLTEMGIDWVRQRVEEGGVYVDQLFFHDPDGFMIEICNCDNIPVVPLAAEMVRSCDNNGIPAVVPLAGGKVRSCDNSSIPAVVPLAGGMVRSCSRLNLQQQQIHVPVVQL